MKKAIAAVAAAAMLTCTLGLAACSGSETSNESSDGGSTEEATEEATEEDLTEEEVYEWYEDNFYGQTLTGTISGVYDDDEYYGDDGEVAASYLYFDVALDEPIERASYEVEEMSAYYFDYDVLSEFTEFIDYDEDDDIWLWWTYDDDTSFSYADGTAASVEDLAVGDVVTITFGDRGEIVEVVIGQ